MQMQLRMRHDHQHLIQLATSKKIVVARSQWQSQRTTPFTRTTINITIRR